MRKPLIDPAIVPLSGVESIDAQHLGLVAALNRLHQTITEGQGEPDLTETMDALESYVAVHIAAEEALLEATGYPGLERHRQIHRGFIAKITEMAVAHRTGGRVLGPDVSRFLATWIGEHIMHEDGAFIPHLRAHRGS